MATIEEALAAGFGHHREGRFPQAETVYRRILEVQPQNAAALHLLGALCLQTGRADAAVPYLESARSADPNNAETLNHLGGAYQACQRWEDSLSVLREAARLQPENAKFHFDLGNSLKALNQHDDAIRAFETAIAKRPDFVQAINNLGTTLTRAGHPDEAIRTLQSALELKPDYANAQNALGNALLDSGRAAEAVSWLRRAASAVPNEPKFHCNLGVALKATGDAEAAFSAYMNALRLAPDMTEARKNLGNLLVSQQRLDDAIREFRIILDSDPEDTDLLTAVGDAYRDLEQFDDATEFYRRAAATLPDDSFAALKEAALCPAVFNTAKEIEEYHRRLRDHVDRTAASAMSLEKVEARAVMPPFNIAYHGLPDRLLREAIAGLYEPTFSQFTAPSASSTNSRVRVGFLVTNGHEGIFSRCMSGIVDRLDRQRFEIQLLAPVSAARCLKAELNCEHTEFVELPERFHRMLPAVRRQDLDVLYFWECGTDLLNYLLPFARLARVQCTGWGLPVTSGIPAMDYYLSSSLAEPEGASAEYSEQLICADTFLTWQEPPAVPNSEPDRSQFGLSPGQNVYLCAQNLRKLHPDFDNVIAEILRRDAKGVVVLVSDRAERITQNIRRRLDQSCPDVSERIVILPRMPFSAYLELLRVADVALDPFHYGSGITAYEIFACGMPLVTLPGAFRRGRFVSGCYRKMDLDQCIAADTDSYIDTAVRFGTSREARDELSREIRERSKALFRDSNAVSEFERILDVISS